MATSVSVSCAFSNVDFTTAINPHSTKSSFEDRSPSTAQHNTDKQPLKNHSTPTGGLTATVLLPAPALTGAVVIVDNVLFAFMECVSDVGGCVGGVSRGCVNTWWGNGGS